MMRSRFVFAYLLGTFCLVAHAQDRQDDYYPFAQEGKIWKAQVGIIMENQYGNCVDGDTLINGESWKKVYNYHGFPEFNYSYYAAIRDVGKKVYAIAKGSSRPRLIYDFGLKEGQTVRVGIEGNAFGCLLDTDENPDTLLGFQLVSFLRVERIDTIKANGFEYRRFILTFLDAFRYPLLDKKESENGLSYETDNIIWVEGVGSSVGPFSPWLPLPVHHGFNIACYVGKTYLFGSSDFYNTKILKDYRPIVEQGKKWTYHHDTYQDTYDYYYMLGGDTIVAEKDCLKMYSENKDNTGIVAYEGALYEENKKVYCFYPGKDEPILLYDFECEVGNTLNIAGADLIVQSIENNEQKGKSVKSYILQAQRTTDDEKDTFVMGTLSWIEGIGATLDFFNMLPLYGNYNHLRACEVNGEVLYEDLTSVIETAHKDRMPDRAIYNLQGRRMSKPTKGISIIRQNDGTLKKVIMK